MMSLANTDPLATPAGPESAAARQRRVASQRVRDARDRLTSTSGTRPAFDYELLRQYAQNRLSGSLGVILLATAIGLISTYWASIAWAGLWMAMVLTIQLASMVKCREFLAQPASDAAIGRARLTFVVLDLLFGLAWTINLVHPADDRTSSDIIDVFVMLLVVAVSSMLGSSLPIAVFATTVPLTAAVAINYLLAGSVHGYVLAGLALTALCYFGLLTNRLYGSNLATLEARAEKDALIGELEQAKAKSDEARRHAEAANIAKSRFLAQMSHELRTPLNAILGFSEVMKNELFGAHAVRAYKDYSDDIHNSGVHLLGLINEILDLSRIEAGRYELNEESVALVQVADECRHLLKLRASNRGIARSVRTGHAAAVGRRARGPADLPQSPVQCHQVHAASRRGVAQGGLDRRGRAVFQRPGQRPRHSRERDTDRAGHLRRGLERDQIGGTGRRARPAHREEPDRAAWWHLLAQIEAARGHRSDRHLPAGARHDRARAGGGSGASPDLRSAAAPSVAGRTPPVRSDRGIARLDEIRPRPPPSRPQERLAGMTPAVRPVRAPAGAGGADLIAAARLHNCYDPVRTDGHHPFWPRHHRPERPPCAPR